MLKRHRQSSPPPTSSNFHLLPNLGAEEPHLKRRRTHQPTQDEEEASQAVGDDDSYEGYRDNLPTHAATHESTEMTNTSEEYKSANTMLRDLHILNQHRLMFSLPAPHSISTSQISSLNPTQQPPYPVPYTGHSTPPTKLHPVQTGKMPKPHSSRHKFAEQGQALAGRLEEASVVSENYENINKLLGTVFLSRRRILNSSSHSVSFS